MRMRIFGNSDSKQVEIQIEDEDRPTTCEDIQLILPTVLIILVTLVIMTTVIPYAFHVVINQLKSHYAEDESMYYNLFHWKHHISLINFRQWLPRGWIVSNTFQYQIFILPSEGSNFACICWTQDSRLADGPSRVCSKIFAYLGDKDMMTICLCFKVWWFYLPGWCLLVIENDLLISGLPDSSSTQNIISEPKYLSTYR